MARTRSAGRNWVEYTEISNLQAVQLLLGHRELESTVCCLGIEVDDALSISEQVDVKCAKRYGFTGRPDIRNDQDCSLTQADAASNRSPARPYVSDLNQCCEKLNVGVSYGIFGFPYLSASPLIANQRMVMRYTGLSLEG
jgi:hypothetical protein